MISYKTWALLRENLDSQNLGIVNPPVLGEGPSMFGMMNKLKKPTMGGDMGGDDMGGMGDMGGKPPMGDKPPMGGDMDAGEDGDEDMDDHEDDDTDGDEDGDEDMDDHDDEDGDEDMGGEEGGEMGDKGPDGMPMKKKKPPMPADMTPAPAPGNPMPAPVSKMKKEAAQIACCPKCKASKKCEKMTKEDNKEFLDALRKQTGTVKYKKDDLGFWTAVSEDALIEPAKPAETQEPGPGEVGFAPQQSLGILGSKFNEWYDRQLAEIKKNRK